MVGKSIDQSPLCVPLSLQGPQTFVYQTSAFPSWWIAFCPFEAPNLYPWNPLLSLAEDGVEGEGFNLYGVIVQSLNPVQLFATAWTNCSTPDFPFLHYLLEFAQTHVYWVSDAIYDCGFHSVCPLTDKDNRWWVMVEFLSKCGPLEKGMENYFSILIWEPHEQYEKAKR